MFPLPQMIPFPTFPFTVGALDWPGIGVLAAWTLATMPTAGMLIMLWMSWAVSRRRPMRLGGRPAHSPANGLLADDVMATSAGRC